MALLSYAIMIAAGWLAIVLAATSVLFRGRGSKERYLALRILLSALNALGIMVFLVWLAAG